MAITQREQSIADALSRAESDLVDIKKAQFFGRDVTTPKINERRNSDGSPTVIDVIGTQEPFLGGFTYRASGYITFTAKSQTNPWVHVVAKVQVNPSNTLDTSAGTGWGIILDANSMFSDDGVVKFSVDASSTNLGTSSGVFTDVDRLWMKFYLYATDEGTVTLDFPRISPYDNVARGTVVPLT